MTRLPGAHYSRRAEEALARGECADPESYDVDAALNKTLDKVRTETRRCVVPSPFSSRDIQLRAREGRVG